jgi:hypothetical protein
VADDPGGQRKRPAESLEVKTVALFLQVKVKTAVALLLLEAGRMQNGARSPEGTNFTN